MICKNRKIAKSTLKNVGITMFSEREETNEQKNSDSFTWRGIEDIMSHPPT